MGGRSEGLKEAIIPSDFLVSALHHKQKLLSLGLVSPYHHVKN